MVIVRETSVNPALAPEAIGTPVNRRRTGHRANGPHATLYGAPRDFLDNRFVYSVVSTRARGLSIGINLCPDKRCNFNCVYCEVRRNGVSNEELDVEVMAAELKKTLAYVREGRMRERPGYHGMPEDLLQLRHVALSGDGEPTLNPRFAEAVQAAVHVRALSGPPFFKLVLLTNGTALDQPHVQAGLRNLTKSDEIWIKLDGGSKDYLQAVNCTDVPLENVLDNIVALGRQRSVVIQSLFPAIRGVEPSEAEIDLYCQRLAGLRDAGADISLVQIYSVTRSPANEYCTHLSLKSLSSIAGHVRRKTGLRAEVF